MAALVIKAKRSEQNIVNDGTYSLLPDVGNVYRILKKILTNVQDSESDTQPPSSMNTSY